MNVYLLIVLLVLSGKTGCATDESALSLAPSLGRGDAQIKVYLRNGSTRPEEFEVVDLNTGESIRVPRLSSGEQHEADLASLDGRFGRLQYRRRGTNEWTTVYSLRKYATVTMR